MREIKFKGKLINKYAEEWFYGDLIQVKDGTVDKKGNPAIDYYIITDDYSSKYNKIELRTCQSPKVNADTIGQYTGLKDKNGVEIYEGDIVKINNDYEKYGINAGEIYQVYFKSGGYRLLPKYCKEALGYWLESGEDFVVIGNVWDNPELLKEGD